MGEGISTITKGSRRERGTGFFDAARKAAAERKVQNTESSPKPTQMADLNSRKFKSAITRAHNYTDDNFHQVASATAAKAFGYPDIEKGFRQIEKEHEKAGSLSGVKNGIERRDALEAELETRIKRDYGKRGLEAWHRAKS